MRVEKEQNKVSLNSYTEYNITVFLYFIKIMIYSFEA